MARQALSPNEQLPKMGRYHEHAVRHHLQNSDFKNEVSLIDYSIHLLAKILGEDSITSIQKEMIVPPGRRRRDAHVRIDLVAVGNSGTHYVIEYKAPYFKGNVELINATAQLNLYAYLYEEWFGIIPKKILISSKSNNLAVHFMTKFCKDIRFIVLTRNYHAELECSNG